MGGDIHSIFRAQQASQELGILARKWGHSRLRGERERDVERGFDLSTDALMRFQIMKLGPASHEIVWSMHHVILDGWSVARLQGEFIEIYGAICGGRPVAAEPDLAVRAVPMAPVRPQGADPAPERARPQRPSRLTPGAEWRGPARHTQ